jgi:NADPH:quinone reductase-like Zn-dependent oxidoreductase
MKAIILKEFGGIENLVKEDIPVPEINDHELLVQVKAFGINPVDIKTRKGKGQAENLKIRLPMILGWDIAGTVIETGKSVSVYKKGDHVFGMINFPGQGRAYAEYVAAHESHVAIKPSNISFVDAAAASLAALTAYQLINKELNVVPDNRILIHSAAGGVGHFAVQFARIMGAYVAGTASSSNRDFILDLGASISIDYETEKFEDILKDMDFVIDTIGGDYVDRSLKVLKKGGRIITLPSGMTSGIEEKAAALGTTGSSFLVRSDGGDMREIAYLLGTGLIKPFVSSVYSFEEIKQAHLKLETGKTKGKVVVSLE